MIEKSTAMTDYCRLCAELKEPHEIVTSISDVEQSMEEKLRACCRWTTENIEQNRLPHSVCAICLDQLDKCWLFSQSLQLAQHRLLEIFQETEWVKIETKPLPTEILPNDYNSAEYSNNFPSTSNVQNDSHQQQGCDGLIEIGLTEVDCKPIVADWNLEYHAEKDENSTIDNDSNASAQNSNHSSQIDLEIKTELNEIETEQNGYDCLDPLESNENDANIDESSLSCQICGEHFATVNILINHLHTHHPNSKLYPCDVCGKSFNRTSNLATHKRSVHQGIRAFECNVCGRRLSCSTNLKNHMITHGQGVRSHKCMECGKCFITYTRLKVHLVVHTGEKAYKCDLCGKSFTQLPNLSTHKKAVHHGIRPYECKECGRHFTCNANLKKHMITHTGLKPFSCDLCGTVFAQSDNLKRHKLKYCSESIKRRK